MVKFITSDYHLWRKAKGRKSKFITPAGHLLYVVEIRNKILAAKRGG